MNDSTATRPASTAADLNELDAGHGAGDRPMKNGDKVRISDRPSSTPGPDDGHGYVQRMFAGQTGVIEQVDDSDGVHLVVVKFDDRGRGKSWIHEAHLTAVGEVES